MKRFSFLLIAVTALMILAQGCKHRPKYVSPEEYISVDSYSGATAASPAEVPTTPDEPVVVPDDPRIEPDGPDEEFDLVGEVTRAAVNRDPRGDFILEGDFMETGQIYCGLQQTGSYSPIYLHLEIYENVMYLTYSGGSQQELPLCKTDNDGLSRHYQMGPSQEYIYDGRFNKTSLLRSFQLDGQGYWVSIVPSGIGGGGASASSNGNYQQQQQMQQQQNYQQQQLEQQYRSQYEMWEQTVRNTWNTLTGMTSGTARTTVRMQMRNAQSQMRAVRQNAQMQGVHIMASPWESTTVPYGLDD